MRYGLGVACLSDRVYSFDWGPTGYGSTYWQYPEFDASGRQLHYLGVPVSDPAPISTDPTTLIHNGGFELPINGSDWATESHEGNLIEIQTIAA